MSKRNEVLYVSQILAEGRIVELSDGSRWHVSSQDIEIAATWASGHQVSLIDGVDDLFPHRLINLDGRDRDIITATRLDLDT